MRFRPFLLILLVFLLPFCAVQAAAPPYLKSVNILLAVDDYADIWINGIYLKRVGYTSLGTGPQPIEAIPSSLCDFHQDNVLAIRVTDTTQELHSQDYIGVTYSMRLTFSDGSVKVLTSEETRDHRCQYLRDQGMSEPEGWEGKTFDDSSWVVAQSSGTSIPGCAPVNSSELDQVVSFLSASGTGYEAQEKGERHLFRRKFKLHLSPNPNCPPETKVVIRTRPTRNPVRSITPEVFVRARNKPIMAAIPTATPTPTVTPTKTATLTPTATATSTFTRIPAAFAPTPPFSPVVIRRTPPMIVRHWPTSTPWVVHRPIVVWPTATPRGNWAVRPPLVPSMTATTTPTSSPTAVPIAPSPVVSDEVPSLAVTFSVPPATVLVNFADGPGTYQVEAVDAEGRHMKTLFDERIVRMGGQWISWDGKDEQGQDVPVGRYSVLCSKEGRMLSKILLIRVP